MDKIDRSSVLEPGSKCEGAVATNVACPVSGAISYRTSSPQQKHSDAFVVESSPIDSSILVGDNTISEKDIYITKMEGINYRDPYTYAQIGCDLYLMHSSVDMFGNVKRKMIQWKMSQLKKDFAAIPDEINRIPRYVDIGVFPSHTDYHLSVCGCFNAYYPLSWQPVPGKWPTIERLIRHIFGDQFEFALDYLTIAYMNPLQRLPIILLVSSERETGKTTFLNFLRESFGANCVFVSNESMRSRFNSDWSGKLFACVDETLLNKREDSEHIKSIATAKTMAIELKGKDRFEMPCFIKFVLCSNNIVDAVYIDSEETRYWVREVPTLETKIPNIMESIKREIPCFYSFLLSRRLSIPEPLSRLWFDMATLKTPALERIIQFCRPTNELELAELLLNLMDKLGVDHLEYTLHELKLVIIEINGKAIRDMHRIITKQWRTPQAANKLTYTYLHPSGGGSERRAGRFFSFIRSELLKHLPKGTIRF